MTKQAGNALFLILIAVGLFAALSYAVTQTSRGGGSIQREQNMIDAAQILQYVTSIKQSIDRMTITGQCQYSDLSFENNIASGYINASSPDQCKLFHPDGGGLSYTSPISTYLDTSEAAESLYGEYWFTATNRITGIGVTGANSTAPDGREIVIYLNWITRDLCMALNELLDYPMPTGEPPIATGTRWDGARTKWIGVFGPEYSYAIQPTGTGTGHRTGCWAGENTPDGGYHFYHVLVER